MDQRRLWLLLLIVLGVLGVSLPAAVAAMPGLDSDDAHHGSRTRSRARLVWLTPAPREIPVIPVASVQLPRRAWLERSTRSMIGRDVRKIPPPIAAAPASAPDH